MLFAGVKLPDELRIALENDRLVIFAGAGVSMPPPSNLPSFHGLASEIAAGTTVEPGREDRFLAKLGRERKTDVHAAAARIVYGEHTRPTLLHREILRVFRAASTVRLVTTNFDDHFSVAARKLYGKPRLREFYAPALPLGDDFSGLVYLHGSSRIDPSKLVMTDSDFGAAYLTRGWARDFLVSLLSHYTVLFVGYSHNDVTMSYLARGLNPSHLEERWAMVPSDAKADARDNWEHLDISAIEYPIDPDNKENTHHALTAFFSQWADHQKETVFVKARRARVRARSLPPESTSDSTYLAYCLSDPRLAEEFCKAIRHAAWVGWMHDRGYFNACFDATTANGKTLRSESVLVDWLCSDVRRRFPDVFLNLLASHRQRLSQGFSRKLAHHVWRDQSRLPDPRFATWVSVLLRQVEPGDPDVIWGYLLTECRLPEHIGVALGLFELLTTPVIRIKKGLDWQPTMASANDIGTSKPRVDYAIEWPCESRHCLREAWTKVFQPHLADVANPLSQIIVNQFTRAYLLLRGVGKRYERFDYLSGTRSSIAPHEQDDSRLEDCLASLIDILRGLLDHWIETEPIRARQQAEAWWSTRLPLLMRFAAYARSRDPQYNPDERIQWVLTNNLVFRSGMKKEVFDILALAYPKASPRTRQHLLRRIDRGYLAPRPKRLDAEALAYEKFNVLVWLRRSDPNCPLVASELAKLQVIHPRFGERDHPEFDVWHGKAQLVDPTEGFDFENILLAPPDDFVEVMLHAGLGFPQRDVWDYIRCLAILFKEKREWARGFVEALSHRSVSNDEIWIGVFLAWRDAIASSGDWCWAIGVFETLPHDSAIYAGIANFVSRGFSEYHRECDEVAINRAACLMDRSWELCKNQRERADDGYGDWLTTAINHVGGWIGEFWVHYCSYLRQRAGEKWQGIPASLKAKMVEAVQGTNRTKVHARIALTPWIGTIFACDREFAVECLLPLLDWQRDPVVAQQSWSVLLGYKRSTSKDLETQLIPFYRQCVTQITGMLRDSTERSGQFGAESLRHLGGQLAVLAIRVIPDPVDSGFFREFLPLLPDEGRRWLAIGMDRELKNLDESECRRVWHNWLRRYLDLRLVGVPVGLSTAETTHMLEWGLHLGPVFSEVVDRLVQMPQKAVFAYGILSDLAKSRFVVESPLASCRLVIAALVADDNPYLHESLLTLHEQFTKTIRREPEFARLEELLYARGWKKH